MERDTERKREGQGQVRKSQDQIGQAKKGKDLITHQIIADRPARRVRLVMKSEAGF